MSTKCRYAKSDMTPCVLRDGAISFAMDSKDQPICVGCERSPADLDVPRPLDWEKTVAAYRKHQKRVAAYRKHARGRK